jgi:predicted dehydrogenase
MSETLKVALVGIGQIAKAEHIPVLSQSTDWQLAALVSRQRSEAPYPFYASIEEALVAMPGLDAVSLATPPQPRLHQALTALRAGKHVMLEKPPGATLAEVDLLAEEARKQGVTLYTSWHSRGALVVEAARKWLQDRRVSSFEIVWRENIREWHPGQDWILDAGGMGVFDPGINALSILTEILPQRVAVRSAVLELPQGKQSPIAATLEMHGADGITGTARFDFLYLGEPKWDIVVHCQDATLRLERGGAAMFVDDDLVAGGFDQVALAGEYAALYRKFAELVRSSESLVDVTPMMLVADAMTVGSRREVAPFTW